MQTVDRSVLASAIFGIQDERATSNLALLLFRTKVKLESIGFDGLQADQVKVWIEPGYMEVDAKSLERACRAARKSREPLVAVSLLRRALLELSGPPLSSVSHRSVDEIREAISRTALQGLLCLAELDPQGQRDFILSSLAKLGQSQPTTSACLMSVLAIYALLGMRREIVESFTEFETYLQNEFGETVGKRLEDALERSLASAERPTELGPSLGLPARPAATLGRETVLDALFGVIQSHHGPVNLVGAPGVGKSHILREFAHMVSAAKSVLFWSAEADSLDALSDAIEFGRPQVVILDQVDALGPHDMARAFRETEGLACVAASRLALGVTDAYVLPLPPLTVGTRRFPGPAAVLLAQQARAHSPGGPYIPKPSDTGMILLAGACDGNPRAIDWAAKHLARYGPKATWANISRDLELSAEDGSDLETRFTLRSVVTRTFAQLPEPLQRVARVLAQANCPVPVPSLPFVFGIHDEGIEMLVSCGLFQVDVNNLITLRSPVRPVFMNLDFATARDDEWRDFEVNFLAWLQQSCERETIDFAFAESMSLADQFSLRRAIGGQHAEAAQIFRLTSRWHGQHKPSRELLNRIALSLWSSTPDSNGLWGETALHVAAASFHAGDYDLMGDILERMISSPAFDELPIRVKCRADTQRGLHLGATRRFEEAKAAYRSVIAEASTEGLHAVECHAWYNLSCIYEAVGDESEAVVCLENAALHVDPLVDPRVVRMIEVSLTRLNASRPLDQTLGDLEELIDKNLWHSHAFVSACTMQNFGRLCFDAGQFPEAALAEAIGTLLLARLNASLDHLRLISTSLQTLQMSLGEIGRHDLAAAIEEATGLAAIIVDRYELPAGSVMTALLGNIEHGLIDCISEVTRLESSERFERLKSIAHQLHLVDATHDEDDDVPFAAVAAALKRKWSLDPGVKLAR